MREFPLSADGLRESVALAGEDQDVRVVDQTIYQRRCQTVIAKDGIPARELKVCGNNQTSPFVAVRDHLKQQLGRILVKRNEAHLVNYDQFHFFQRVQECSELPFLILFQEQICKRRRCKKAGVSPLFTRLHGDRGGKMGLTIIESFS